MTKILVGMLSFVGVLDGAAFVTQQCAHRAEQIHAAIQLIVDLFRV